jgi:hypothetical protein
MMPPPSWINESVEKGVTAYTNKNDLRVHREIKAASFSIEFLQGSTRLLESAAACMALNRVAEIGPFSASG